MSAAIGTLWNAYVAHLVDFTPDSWVASTASTFRVLAVLTIVPGILLTLLDVTSYAIARTLGDPTASTSARFVPLPPSPPPELAEPGTADLADGGGTLRPMHSLSSSSSSSLLAAPLAPSEPRTPPEIHISSNTPSPPSSRLAAAAAAAKQTPSSQVSARVPLALQPQTQRPLSSGAAFGVDEDPHGPGPRLAGVGVFSPAASMPGSPVVERRALAPSPRELAFRMASVAESEERAAAAGGQRETFGGESYALLDRDESWEDAGLHFRRRNAPRRQQVDGQGAAGTHDDTDAPA